MLEADTKMEAESEESKDLLVSVVCKKQHEEPDEHGSAAHFLLVGANNVEAVFVGKEQPMISAAGGVLVSVNNISNGNTICQCDFHSRNQADSMFDRDLVEVSTSIDDQVDVNIDQDFEATTTVNNDLIDDDLADVDVDLAVDDKQDFDTTADDDNQVDDNLAVDNNQVDNDLADVDVDLAVDNNQDYETTAVNWEK